MLNHNQKQKLLANWGDLAESMACRAEVRLYDPKSSWETYIYAMNPENDDEIMCITKCFKHDCAITEYTTMKYILGCFNEDGENLKLDHEYRPRRAAELFKKLNEGMI